MTDFFSVCAVCKDEHPYIVEWLNYHLLIGAQHFYLYDNNSKVSLKLFLKEFINMGLVTVIDWPGKFDCYYQCAAYQHYLINYGPKTEWAANIDIDEFIFPKNGNLKSLLERFTPYAGLSINWQIFGSNGHKTKPDDLVLRSYTKRPVITYPANRVGKTIYQPSRIELAKLHIPTPKGDFTVVNENFNPATERLEDISVSKIQVNHYYTKSEEEWVKKKMAQDSWNPPRKSMDRFRGHNVASTVEDTAILDFVFGVGHELH